MIFCFSRFAPSNLFFDIHFLFWFRQITSWTAIFTFLKFSSFMAFSWSLLMIRFFLEKFLLCNITQTEKITPDSDLAWKIMLKTTLLWRFKNYGSTWSSLKFDFQLDTTRYISKFFGVCILYEIQKQLLRNFPILRGADSLTNSNRLLNNIIHNCTVLQTQISAKMLEFVLLKLRWFDTALILFIHWRIHLKKYSYLW